MNLLIHFFLMGLIAGIPLWVVWQHFRPRFGGLSLLRRQDIKTLEITPVVLKGDFVNDAPAHSE